MPYHIFSEELLAEFQPLVHFIEDAQHIAICAHASPDGDALGSELALAELIQIRWPEKTVACLLADEEPLAKTYAFLPGFDRLIRVAEYTDPCDLFICVDLSQRTRLASAEQVCISAKTVAVIDHHPYYEPYWDAAVIHTEAAATGFLIAAFASALEIDYTPTLACNLMCALMTDTGRFQYQNATPEVFHLAGVLVAAGARVDFISREVYHNARLNYLHMSSLVLSRIALHCKGKLALSSLSLEDFERHPLAFSECDGFVDLVRQVEEVRVAVFMKEVAPHQIRVNLRSKYDDDVSALARFFGGGGHRLAAGFTFSGSLDACTRMVCAQAEAMLFAEDSTCSY